MRTAGEAKVASFTVIANENIEIDESEAAVATEAPEKAEVVEAPTTEGESEA